MAQLFAVRSWLYAISEESDSDLFKTAVGLIVVVHYGLFIACGCLISIGADIYNYKTCSQLSWFVIDLAEVLFPFQVALSSAR